MALTSRKRVVFLPVGALVNGLYVDHLLAAGISAQGLAARQIRTVLGGAEPGRDITLRLVDGKQIKGKFQAIRGDVIDVQTEAWWRRPIERELDVDTVSQIQWHRLQAPSGVVPSFSWLGRRLVRMAHHGRGA